MLRKRLTIFFAIFSILFCKGQKLDQDSLAEHYRDANNGDNLRIYTSGFNRRGSANEDPARFPHCMLESSGPTLWCDGSRYNYTSDIRMMDSDISEIADQIKTLYINDSRLLALEVGGLSHFSKLTTFVAEDNFLVHLKAGTFKPNSLLETIDISMNRIGVIEDGAFEGLGSLMHLDISSNNINKITRQKFRGLRSLEYLSLNGNHLQIIPSRVFIDLKRLKKLTLKDNGISEIRASAFSELRAVEVLDLSYNAITEIRLKTFKPMKNLRDLNLRHNGIKDFPYDLKALTIHLRILDIGSNHLQSLPEQSLHALTELRYLLDDNVVLQIDHNSLTKIEETTFQRNLALEFLNLSMNEINAISANAFSNNRHLSTLLLQANHLRSPEKGWFSNLQTLATTTITIDLEDNEWWCDCDTKSYENYVIELANRGEFDLSDQLDILCSSNKEYAGRLLSLDIYCPQYGSTTSTTNTPSPSMSSITSTTTAMSTTTRRLFGVFGMLDEGPAQTSATMKVISTTAEIMRSSEKQNKAMLVFQKTPFPAISGPESSSSSTPTVFVAVVVVIAAALIIGFIIFKQKSKKGYATPCGSSRRKRHPSTQPMLEDRPCSGDTTELADVFSGSEEYIPARLGHELHPMGLSQHAGENDRFYTPSSTPQVVSRTEHGAV